MFQNMRVDIIYYKTNTDFEMEFNLCGCCRMRLLTDKAMDRKIMVHSLARAVSRSRIIISVGPLFSEDGIISTVAAAIGNSLSVVDNKKYGIKTNSEIQIISGATPLVTADGLFGGCIIESGPQTMILLTESKSIRKSIMEDLIHPYIAELYASEVLQAKVDVINKTEQTESLQDTEEVAEEETQIIVEESEEDTKEEENRDANLIIPPDVIVAPAVIPSAPTLDMTAGLEPITEIKESKIELFTEGEEPEIEIDTSELILDIEADAEETKNEEILPDIAANELISDVEEEDDLEIDTHIQLVHNNTGEEDPIAVEVPNLIMDEEHDEADQLIEEDIEGIIIEDEGESDEEFRFPEVERELYHTIDEVETVSRQEQGPQDDEFLLEENPAEKKMNMLDAPILALTILLLLIVGVIGYFMFYLPYTSGVSPVDYVREIYETLFK